MKNLKNIFLLLMGAAFVCMFAFAPSSNVPYGGLGKPNDTSIIVNADSAHMLINGQDKGPLPNKNYIRVVVHVEKKDSIKTNKAFFEGSITGKAGEWFREDLNTDSLVFTNTTGTKLYTMKYGPVTWKYNRLTIVTVGNQKFKVTGEYDNQ